MLLLERMPNGDLELVDFGRRRPPQYAILSHTWGDTDEEVTVEDMDQGVGRDKRGFQKIIFCSEQAAQDGLRYSWVDTCCVDRDNWEARQEAFSSMFRWYQRSEKCYVYLSDISDKEMVTATRDQALQRSRWFTRGWTLQELLAPTSVEFFSAEGTLLGNKESFEDSIHRITGIPVNALRGCPLSQFDVKTKLRWQESRRTTLEEDIAYSLLGMFGVDMLLHYGEGKTAALQRLHSKLDKLERCCQDLNTVDPASRRENIIDGRGGLLRRSYEWILQNVDFRTWREAAETRLLCITGSSGKGKTMLLCGIIEELPDLAEKTANLSYFFCEATDFETNNAAAVLRGLIFTLFRQQPSLFCYLEEKYKLSGKSFLYGAEAWLNISEIFTRMLRDQNINSTYLIIDAIDECTTPELSKLLRFIAANSFVSSRVKWIVSSRNLLDITEQLLKGDQVGCINLSLELNAKVMAQAVDSYIAYKVSEIYLIADDEPLQAQVRKLIHQKANETFMWVAVAMEELQRDMESEEDLDILDIIGKMPSGLAELYAWALRQIGNSSDEDWQHCKNILSTLAVVYRPLWLEELYIGAGLKGDPAKSHDLERLIRKCGSFLTCHDNQVYFIHQSAKDFLTGNDEAQAIIFPQGVQNAHRTIFSRSLQPTNLPGVLRRNIYELTYPGTMIDDVIKLVPDPLGSVRYFCLYWARHVYDGCNGNASSTDHTELADDGEVIGFLKHHFLHWLEALSLLRNVYEGVLATINLKKLLARRSSISQLYELVDDMHRFILHSKSSIETAPLQVYSSAILFSPTQSVTRKLFETKELEGIAFQPLDESWEPCMQVLECQGTRFTSVTFSPEGETVASTSGNMTVCLWDEAGGWQRLTLKGHSGEATAVAFSPDGQMLALGSEDGEVQLWDIASGAHLSTLVGHNDVVTAMAFLTDGKTLASTSDDGTVRLWDAASGAHQQTVRGQSGNIKAVAASLDGKMVALTLYDKIAQLWDVESGECQQILGKHSKDILVVVFSPDGKKLASGTEAGNVRLWDIVSGTHWQTLEGTIESPISALAFSPDGKTVASGSTDGEVRLWDATSGAHRLISNTHRDSVTGVAFSPDGKILASSSYDATVRLWDATKRASSQALERHSDFVTAVAFSPDGRTVASGSFDSTVRLWNAASGAHWQTLEGHPECVLSVVFSLDGEKLASSSPGGEIMLWEAMSGGQQQIFKPLPSSSLSFSGGGSNLKTDHGTLGLSTESSSVRQSSPSTNHSLTIEKGWILRDGRRLLLLHPNERPYVTAAHQNAFAFGYISGQVKTLIFDVPDNLE